MRYSLEKDLKKIISKIELDGLLKVYLNVERLEYISQEYISYLDYDLGIESIVNILYLNGIIKYHKKEVQAAYYTFLDILRYIKSIDIEENKEIITKTYIYLTLCSITINKESNIAYFYKKAKNLINEYDLLECLLLLNMKICSLIYLIPQSKSSITMLIDEVKCLDITENKALVCKSKYIFGKIYLDLFNDFIESIEHLTKGIKIAQENNFDVLEIACKSVIGACYSESENNLEAIKYLEETLKSSKLNNKISLADNINLEIDLIWACIKENLYEKSKLHIDYILKNINSIDDVYKELWYSDIYIFLAVIELREEKFDFYKVKGYLEKSEEIFYKYRNAFRYNSDLYYIYKILGDLYVKSNEIDKGIKFYYKGLRLVVNTSLNPSKISEFYRLIASSYELKEDYKNAIKNYRYMDKYLDKWQNDSTHKVSQNMYKHYEFKKKEDHLRKLELSTRKLQVDVLEDALTGLYNRRYLQEYMDNFKSKDLTSVIIDIDYFKKYNDNYGHLKGDLVIKKVSNIINTSFKDITNHIIRYGGEEYLILIEDEKIETIEECIKKLYKLIELEKIEHLYSEVKDHITISCGIYKMYCNGKKDIISIIEKSDELLYNAKNHGRNIYIL